MHASRMKSSVIAALLSAVVSASPAAVSRAITESALDPWVSVDTSGIPIATITPVLTTVNGVATTISAAPPSLTATTTSALGDGKPTQTSEPNAGDSYLLCNNKDGDYAPFCKPDNGSSVYVGETYYVTWDTSYLDDLNSTVVVQGDYVNATGGGEQAFHSTFTENTVGSVPLTIDKAWLKGGSSNNITLFLFPVNAAFGDPIRITGPTVMVTNRPPDEPYRQEPAKAPKGKDLYIALPTVFGFILLCVVGGYFWNRKHRKIDLGNVMGRKQGYGTSKSKTQRMGFGKKRAAAIILREQELTSGAQYTDQSPPKAKTTDRGHMRADSDALGSLASSPTREGTNYFRDEIKRQEQGRF